MVLLPAFNGMDVITFAVEIEKNGRNFYGAVAEKIQDAEVKETFLMLKGQEEQHIKDFEQLLTKTTDQQAQETYDGEYLEYVKALVDNHVFNPDADINALADQVKTKAEGINLALRFEKDSIIFFTELKNIVAPHSKEIVEELINQEREHIRVLSKIKKED